MRPWFLSAAMALLYAGCTALTSDTPLSLNSEKRAASGVHYSLPQGFLNLTLSGAADGAVALHISEPQLTADPTHSYFLRYQPHPSYDDNILIELEEGTPFLSKVHSTTIDKTRDILVELTKAASFFTGGFQSAPVPSGSRLLARATLDPSDPADVERVRRELEEAMFRFAVRQRRDLGCLDKAPPADSKASCTHLRTLLARHDAFLRGKPEGEPVFMLSVVGQPRPASGRRNDCSSGLCYRPKSPYLIAFSVAGVTDTKMVELPNGSEPISVDISRAFLVKKVQEIDFDNGFPTQVVIKKDSELLALANLPLDILGAISEGLQLRISYTQNKTQSAEKEAAILRKRAQLRAEQRKRAEDLKAKQAAQATVSRPAAVEGAAAVPDTAQTPLPATKPSTIDPNLLK